MKVTTESYAFNKPYSSIQNYRNRDGEIIFKKWVYVFAEWMVAIYQQGYGDDSKYVTLQTVMRGREYFRTIDGRMFTNIWLARKAGDFVTDLYSEVGHRGLVKNLIDFSNAIK